METNKKKPTRKILIIIAISIVSIIAIILLAAYLLIHSYINKMNLVSSESDLPNQLSDNEGDSIDEELDSLLDQDHESGATDITDSPEEEINYAEDKIRVNMEENKTPIIEDKDVFNILLIGSDTRKSGGRGRSDSMILISINKKTKTITATSILRDIYL